MKIQVLKSKLKKVYITSSERNYQGSLALCPELIKAANLVNYERVEVNSVYGLSRIVTYVVEGKSGEVGLRGGATNFFQIGEAVHINCYAEIDEGESFSPKVVVTDEKNRICG